MDNETAGVRIDVTIDSLAFIELFNNQFSLDLRSSVLEINCKKNILKIITLLCRDKPPEIKYDFNFELYLYI